MCSCASVVVLTCRPGSYEHDVPVNRHVEYQESFGGKRTLRGIVTVKCTNGVPEKVGQSISSTSVIL